MNNAVFVVIPYSPVYDKVYNRVIRPTIDKCGLTALRADEITVSRPFAKDIIDSIKDCEVIIIEATEPNRNVHIELGLTLAEDKEIILLAKQGTDLPSDTRHIRYLIYKNQTDLRIKLLDWIKSTSIYYRLEKKRRSHLLARGDIFPDIVDATFYMEIERNDLRKRLREDLLSGSFVRCEHIWGNDLGALRWLQLCDDTRYKIFHSSVYFLSQKADELFECLGDSFINRAPDYISLGPGNGQKDKIILEQLHNRLKIKGIQEELYYYPYDISLYMLSTAIRAVLAEEYISSRLRIKAICAEFDKIRIFKPVYDYRSAPNLFGFLGNTIGNMADDIDFIKKILVTMNVEDVLILEVRLFTSGNLSPGGSENLRKKFNFTPLELLGIPYNPEKLVYEKETGCSQVPETISLAGKYTDFDIDENHIDSTILTYINHYKIDELTKCLISIGFDIVKTFQNDEIALLVLKKKIQVKQVSNNHN